MDGPAASGKSSLSQALAKKLGWPWLSTGVFYRGVAFMALHVQQQEEKAIVELIKTAKWSVKLHKQKACFIYKEEDITPKIYTDEVDSVASRVASFPLVRRALLSYQRSLKEGAESGLVAEGRDCGTVVFPSAILKVYLTAPPEVRAQRRAEQRGLPAIGDVIAQQNKRDKQDISRADSPLCQPEGAFIIDTSRLTFEEMVQSAYNQLTHLNYV